MGIKLNKIRFLGLFYVLIFLLIIHLLVKLYILLYQIKWLQIYCLMIFGKLNQIDFNYINSVNGFPINIVPNIVHYVRLDNPNVTFVEMVCMKSAYVNIKPEKIIIHYNILPSGYYWDQIKSIPIIELNYRTPPFHIYGKNFSNIFHVSDIVRIEILMEYGGIYLDNDVYVIKSLNQFRKYEFTLGWPKHDFLGTQVLIAHKNARFLPLWHKSYIHYNGSLWYYNAGELPTRTILEKQPYLVHRVEELFGIQTMIPFVFIAHDNFDWHEYYTIHLLINHRYYFTPNDPIKKFDHENIKKYIPAFGNMARLIYYGSEDIIYD